MALQMRPDARQAGGGDSGKWYSPGRDLLHLMPPLLESIFKGMDESDPWLSEFLNRGGDPSEIDRAATALVHFMALAKDERNAMECYLKSGLDKASPEALDMISRRILRAFLGVFHKGVGEMSEEKEVFPNTVKGYVGAGLRVISEWKWLHTPWWRKCLVRINKFVCRKPVPRKELW